jgi:hypothetical protein
MSLLLILAGGAFVWWLRDNDEVLWLMLQFGLALGFFAYLLF